MEKRLCLLFIVFLFFSSGCSISKNNIQLDQYNQTKKTLSKALLNTTEIKSIGVYQPVFQKDGQGLGELYKSYYKFVPVSKFASALKGAKEINPPSTQCLLKIKSWMNINLSQGKSLNVTYFENKDYVFLQPDKYYSLPNKLSQLVEKEVIKPKDKQVTTCIFYKGVPYFPVADVEYKDQKQLKKIGTIEKFTYYILKETKGNPSILYYRLTKNGYSKGEFFLCVAR